MRPPENFENDDTELLGINTDPLCANCHSGMSARPQNKWFCPGCAEYGSYVGTIEVSEPEHPSFLKWIKEDVDRLVGYGVVERGRKPNDRRFDRDDDYRGTITEITDDDEPRVIIENDPHGLFDTSRHELTLTELFDVVWTVPHVGDYNIPKDAHLALYRE